MVAISTTAAASLATPAAAEATTTPENGGFEAPSGDGSVPAWSQTFGAAPSFNLVADAFDGAQAVRMVDASPDQPAGLQSQMFPVVAGTRYQVDAAVKRESGLPGIYLLFFNDSGSRVGDGQQFSSTPQGNWDWITLTAAAPQGATKAAVLLYSSGYQTTTATWDSVTVGPAQTSTWHEQNVADPIHNVAVLAAGFGTTPQGRHLAYLPMSGTPGALSVADTLTGEVLGTYELPGAEGSWGVTTTADGTAYVSGWPNGRLYRYRPGADAVEDLGQPVPGQSFLWKLDVGDDGRVYGGTYPGGAVFSYDPATGATRNFGQVMAGSQYVRDVAAGNGKVYAGLGTVRARVVEIDTATGERREIPLPAPYDSEGTVYDVDLVDQRLFVRVEQTSTLLVHDLRTGKWVANLGQVKGLQVSEPDRAGRVYFASADNKLRSYQLHSGTVTDTGRTVPGSTRGFSWVRLPDGTGFPDQTLVMGTYSGALWMFNPATGNTKDIVPELPGLPVPLRSLAQGPDKRIYTSGYQSGGLAAYDHATGQAERFPRGTVGQVEGYGTAAGKLFFGVYPGAHLFEFDPAKPFDYGTNPRRLASLTADGQDRAVAWASNGDQLAVGYIPTYGQLGGSVSLIDATTGAVRSFHDVVPDASVSSVEFVDGMLLGGTTVWGGLGSTPTRTEGSMFLLDPTSGEVVWEGVPVPGEKAVTALRRAPDGTVWGITAGTIFQFDVASRQVLRTQKIRDVDWGGIQHLWTSGEIAFGGPGEMFALIRGELYLIDPATLRRELVASAVEHFVRADDGSVYVIRNQHLVRVTR
ncbi:hypothetical protein [Micromonospora sp. NPDC048830]|uniref:hypothetical protein n=1 Tax=Micromonospora sp. NPDC048830 TaxID=3364257 RepID=UPI00370FFB5C